MNDTLPEPYNGLGQIEYYLERYDRCQRWHKKRLSCYSPTDVEGIEAVLRLMETDAALDNSLREPRIAKIRRRIPAGQDGIDLVQSIVGARAFQAFQGEDYNLGKITAGVQYESYLPSALLGYSPVFDGNNAIGTYYLNFKHEELKLFTRKH